MTRTLSGQTPARAWIDDSIAEWDREARSYGPDEDDFDELRARLDAEAEAPDDDAEPLLTPDHDDDTGEFETPVEVPDDVFEREAMTLTQWEFVADMEWTFGPANVRTAGGSVWVPLPESRVRKWLAIGWAFLAGCPTFETVFGSGCWIDLAALAN